MPGKPKNFSKQAKQRAFSKKEWKQNVAAQDDSTDTESSPEPEPDQESDNENCSRVLRNRTPSKPKEASPLKTRTSPRQCIQATNEAISASTAPLPKEYHCQPKSPPKSPPKTVYKDFFSMNVLNPYPDSSYSELEAEDKEDDLTTEQNDRMLLSGLKEVLEEDKPWNTYLQCDPDSPNLSADESDTKSSIRVDGSVLAANADLFKKTFVNFRKKGFQTPILELNGVSESLVESLVQFSVCGEVEVEPKNVEKFYNLIQILDMKAVRDEMGVCFEVKTQTDSD